MIIVDVLCLESILILLSKKEYKKYNEIGYCRKTALGWKLLQLLPSRIKRKFKQYDDDLNDLIIDGRRLSVLTVYYAREVADKIDLSPLEGLYKVLPVSKNKLIALYKAHSTRMSLSYVEAMLRGKLYGCDVLIDDYFKFGTLVDIDGRVVKYDRKIDFSGIISRDRFNRDVDGAPYNYARVTASLGIYLYYIFALISIVKGWFVRKDDITKSVAVQVPRDIFDFDSKNDLYWVDDYDFLENVLLIENRSVQYIGMAATLSKVGIGFRKGVLLSSTNAVNNPKVASVFLGTFPASIKICACLIRNKQISVFFPGLMQVFIYKSIFDAYKVKVYISNVARLDSAQSLAADMSQTVFVRGCWSNQCYTHPEIATSADVLFAWGDVTVDSFKKAGSLNVTYVKTGFIDGKLLEAQLAKCRDNRRAAQVKICFFDNVTGCDICNSLDDLRQVLRMLMSVVIENENVVLVYKPKSGDFQQVVNCGLYDEFTSLEAVGRIVTLVGQRGYDHVPSSLAGNMDMVIGFPISSAVTEVSLAGVPGLHINLTQIHEHPWENSDGKPATVCHSTSEAKAIITSFLADNYFPDGKEIRKSVNYFEDFSASKRMQYYIEMLCVPLNADVSDRIKFANEKYVGLYGGSAIDG